MVYHHLKLHVLLDGNGPAIWSGFLDIKHIKKIISHFGRHDLVSVRILSNCELFRAIMVYILERYIKNVQ